MTMYHWIPGSTCCHKHVKQSRCPNLSRARLVVKLVGPDEEEHRMWEENKREEVWTMYSGVRTKSTGREHWLKDPENDSNTLQPIAATERLAKSEKRVSYLLNASGDDWNQVLPALLLSFAIPWLLYSVIPLLATLRLKTLSSELLLHHCHPLHWLPYPCLGGCTLVHFNSYCQVYRTWMSIDSLGQCSSAIKDF